MTDKKQDAGGRKMFDSMEDLAAWAATINRLHWMQICADMRRKNEQEEGQSE